MRTKKSNRPTTLIAIDPAMRDSGVCYRTIYRWPQWQTISGIENLSTWNPDLDPAETDRVFAIVEYPTWRGHGAEQIRAAANAWIRHLKTLFPGRGQLRVHRVTPQTWMASFGFLNQRRDGEWIKPAELYIPTAMSIINERSRKVGLSVMTLGENEAAAYCLMEYGDSLIEQGRFGKPAQRAELRKAA